MRAMSVVRLRRTGEVHAGNERCEVKTDRNPERKGPTATGETVSHSALESSDVSCLLDRYTGTDVSEER
jgi:hypothetical protein